MDITGQSQEQLVEILIKLAGSLTEEDLMDPATFGLASQLVQMLDPKANPLPQELVDQLKNIHDKATRFKMAAQAIGANRPDLMDKLVDSLKAAGLWKSEGQRPLPSFQRMDRRRQKVQFAHHDAKADASHGDPELKKAMANPIAKPAAPHNDHIRSVADSYAGSKGFKIQHDLPKVKVNPEFASRVATAYQGMEHSPAHPQTKAAYDALIDETTQQLHHLQRNGYKFSAIKPGQANPYASGSAALNSDLRDNKHAHYYPTDQGFGSTDSMHPDHPMLRTVKDLHGNEMPANDAFRIVHDVFGHAKEGHSFGPNGEEAAYRHHSQMFSPLARRALTAETRGQNSWVNFGPHAAHNRANPEKTIFADQKAGLLPSWAEEHYSDEMKKSEKHNKTKFTHNEVEAHYNKHGEWQVYNGGYGQPGHTKSGLPHGEYELRNIEVKRINPDSHESPLNNIDPLGDTGNEEQAKKYSKLKTKAPAIIVKPHPDKPGHYETMDGVHRARAAHLRGDSHIQAFVHLGKKGSIRKSEESLDKGINGNWQDEGYTLTHTNLPGGNKQVDIHHADGSEVGRFVFANIDNKLVADSSYVNPKHRRKGLASAAYKLVEQKNKIKVQPSNNQTKAAKKLWSQPNRPFGKSEESLEKGINGDWEKEGYTFRASHSKNAGHTIRAYKGKTRVGHLAFLPDADKNGYHNVYNAHISEEHRGKGLYQEMIRQGVKHAQSLGSKGLKTDGFQRSGDATRAWQKINPEVKEDNPNMIGGKKFTFYADERHLSKAEGDNHYLEHYSAKDTKFDTLDPNFHGTGVSGDERKRLGRPNRTYYYDKGTANEPRVTKPANFKYIVKAPSKILDLASKEAEPHIQAAKNSAGVTDHTQLEHSIKNAGYDGYRHSGSALPNVVALFHAQKPVETHDLRVKKSDKSDSAQPEATVTSPKDAILKKAQALVDSLRKSGKDKEADILEESLNKAEEKPNYNIIHLPGKDENEHHIFADSITEDDADGHFKNVGYMHLDGNRVTHVSIHPDHRHQGLPVKMYHKARQLISNIKKSDFDSVTNYEELYKGKNRREQQAKVFGGWKTSPDSPRRAKQMAALEEQGKRRYGLGTERAPGKENSSGKIIDKPTFDNPGNKIQHIGNPDSLVHEHAHLEVEKQGSGLKNLQDDMDSEWGAQNLKYGYKQQARVKDEYSTTALENPLRRRAGLPAHQKETKEKNPKRDYAADVPGKKITQEIPGGKKLTGTSSNRTPEHNRRMDQVDRGELKFHPEKGWQPGTGVNSKINQRAREIAENPANAGRKDAKTLMRGEDGSKPLSFNDMKKADLAKSWEIKLKGQDGYHPVRDVVDQGTGKQNAYILHDGTKVNHEKIEDLRIGAKNAKDTPRPTGPVPLRPKK